MKTRPLCECDAPQPIYLLRGACALSFLLPAQTAASVQNLKGARHPVKYFYFKIPSNAIQTRQKLQGNGMEWKVCVRACSCCGSVVTFHCMCRILSHTNLKKKERKGLKREYHAATVKQLELLVLNISCNLFLFSLLH